MSKAKKFKELVKKKAQPDTGKEATRDEWVADVFDLFETVGTWLQEEDIEYRAQTSTFVDAKIGEYHSMMLVLTYEDYEATIRPEYSAPIGKGSCVRIKSGKKSGGNVKILTRDNTDETVKWKVPITPSGIGKKLDKDRFFDLLISIFDLEEE